MIIHNNSTSYTLTHQNSKACYLGLLTICYIPCSPPPPGYCCPAPNCSQQVSQRPRLHRQKCRCWCGWFLWDQIEPNFVFRWFFQVSPSWHIYFTWFTSVYSWACVPHHASRPSSHRNQQFPQGWWQRMRLDMRLDMGIMWVPWYSWCFFLFSDKSKNSPHHPPSGDPGRVPQDHS